MDFLFSFNDMDLICIQATQLHMTFGILLLCLSNAVYAEESCQIYQPTEPLENYSCPQTTNTLILEQATWAECVNYCMHKQCRSISHNSFERICLLELTPCTVLQPNQHFTIQMLNAKSGATCVSWVAYNGQIPARRVEDASSRMIVVAARFSRNGDLLPAKYEIGTDRVYSVLNGVGVEEASSPSMEFLVVDPLCSMMWIPYNSSGSEPLPRNAVMAGHKADGTPLYTARMWISIPQATEFSYGYYDPQNKYGFCHLWYAHDETVMDVLCSF